MSTAVDATKRDDVEVVRAFVSASSLPVEDCNALLVKAACSYGALKVLKWLVEERNASVVRGDKNGDTPVLIATRNGHVEVLRYLCNKGANIEHPYPGEGTPLIFAARSGQLDLVMFLVQQGANVHATTMRGETPLLVAIRHGNFDIVQYFVESKLIDISSPPPNGAVTFPLMYAVQCERPEMVKYLLSKGCNINEAEKDTGKTVLMWAAAEENVGLLSLLLSYSPDVKMRDQSGQQAKDCSTNVAVLRLLEEAARRRPSAVCALLPAAVPTRSPKKNT
eukprot:GILJ01013714.1.p1 GENE.GILJ01013714.1~~GILJ01013714.1.p1  ORF type:complete len:279 (+),score=50.62 GILJ01013714.1:303-1139(+)